MSGFQPLVAGDAALLLEFGQEIDEDVNKEVQRLAAAFLRTPPSGVRGVVPAYTTLLVEFDPLAISAAEVVAKARAMAAAGDSPPGRTFIVPTCYGGEFGPDLEGVAAYLGLSPEDVVVRHSAQDFLIFCLGFTPGFPFCGILPSELEVPRHETPRAKVPAGSVGLAGRQTGVYPAVSPGGWQLVGRTPVPLFDVSRDPPVAFAPGDRLRFAPIGEAEYRRLLALAEQGLLELEVQVDGQD